MEASVSGTCVRAFLSGLLDSILISILFFKILFIYLREREPTSQVMGRAEEEGERESQADFMLNMEPSAGLDLTILTS